MQWLIDLVAERVIATIGIPPVFIDRGDPAAPDHQIGDFTTDGNWHELDLSAIVPEGAGAAAAYLKLQATVAANWIAFTPADHINDDNRTALATQAANIIIESDVTLVVDSDRKVRYKTAIGNWTTIQLTVKGWWL